MDPSSPCPIHDPSPISLVSHTRYFGASEKWSQGLRICGEFTSSLIFSSAMVWVSDDLQGAFSPCSYDRVLDQDANSRQNLLKNMTTPSIPRNSLRLLGTLKSNTFLRFLESTCKLSRVNMYPKISRRLVKNWHLLAFNQNFSSKSHCRTFRKVAICSSYVCEKIIISSM